MNIRNAAMISAAIFALGAAACTEAEQENAQADAAVAGEKVGEVAAETGEVLEAGAMKAAQAVEKGAGKVADTLEETQAEAAAQGRDGAVDPATDQRR